MLQTADKADGDWQRAYKVSEGFVPSVANMVSIAIYVVYNKNIGCNRPDVLPLVDGFGRGSFSSGYFF